MARGRCCAKLQDSQRPGKRAGSAQCFSVGLLSSEHVSKTVFPEFPQYIITVVMTRSWRNSKNEMWQSCRKRTTLEEFTSFVLLCEDQPVAAINLPPPPPPTPSIRPLLCLLKAVNLHCRCVLFFPGVALTLISLLIPGQQSSVSEASLSFRDVDFDAVCALRGRVLAKGRSLFRSQQPLAGLLPLLLCWSCRRWGWGVEAPLLAQRRSSFTGLLWRRRGRLVLLLEGWDMARGDRDSHR